MSPQMIIALSSLVIALISLITAIYFNIAAKEHNKKSVVPIPYLSRSDFEDKLMVRLFNKGLGPLIVTKVIARHEIEKKSGPLIDIIPIEEGIVFDNFSKFSEKRIIPPNESNDMVVLSIDNSDESQVNYHPKLRRFLKDVVIEINYTDVYDSKFETYIAKCDWFGRNVEED